MIFDQATESQMQAARILSGGAMVGFLAAPMFRSRAKAIRVAVAGVYIAGILVFVLDVLFF